MIQGWRLAVGAGTFGSALLVLGFGGAIGLSSQLAQAVALVTMTMVLFASGAVPAYIASASFFALAIVFSVASPEIILSGFASEALLLVLGGMLIGDAIQSSGLGDRLARFLSPVFGRGYGTAIFSMVFLALLFSFFMPSAMGRIVLLVPLSLVIADRLGFAAGRPGRTGLALAAGVGSFMPAFSVLPANVPNIVLMGGAQSIYDINLTFASYLLYHFPIIGVAKAGLLGTLIVWLFPDRLSASEQTMNDSDMSAAARRLAILLACAIGLWLTDFVHGITPAWVGLAVGLLCLLPFFRGPGRVRPWRSVDLRVIIYVAAIISIGAVVTEAGAAPYLGRLLIEGFGLSPNHDFYSFGVLSLVASALGLVATLPGVAAILTPLAGDLSAATGLSLLSVLMLQVTGFSTVFLPYQAPPLMVAASLGKVTLATMARCTLALAVGTILIFIPLNFLWWRLLGLL